MMSEHYGRAHKMGKKDYQARMLQGQQPTLPVLNDILPPKGSYSEVPLGLVQIPLAQVAGTKNGGRSSAFAWNFMPILDEGTEFAAKWSALCQAHLEEGIRDPIKVYEYMNRFYVEGNKRVSVLKYFGADSIPGTVIRILPARTEEKENRLYYEFVDFYALSEINYIWFSELGSFQKLQKAVGKGPKEVWTGEDRMIFSSNYSRFLLEYEANGGKKLSITPGDAFLSFITLYRYQALTDMTVSEMKKLIIRSWEEFRILEEEQTVALKMDPSAEKKPLLSRLLGSSGTSNLKVGFLYEKTPRSSAWTYNHELGRYHLENTFPNEITTVAYHDVTGENAGEYIEKAIAEGCNLIFTTTPAMVNASVKAAIAYPEIRILNCSLNTSHRYIRNYYARMFEAKFLMGAIAGSLAENDRVAYMEDYPIYGSIANINAFALGAKMINPRVQVYLEWSSRRDVNPMDTLFDVGPDCISGKDMIIPECASRDFGLFRFENDYIRNLAMPVLHWGKFYEQMIRTIMNGTWKYDDASTTKAINYWWGMSSGVISVICSNSLPLGTKRLVELLKKTIETGEFNPFSGVLYSQNGVISEDPNRILTPEEIVTMDWLAENVIGEIPKIGQLQEKAKPVISQQGVEKDEV